MTKISNAINHHKRIKGLNIIRTFAMVLILIYHFAPQLLSGGFLAVNVFFVFSGFLVHKSLIGKLEATNELDLKAYYNKRFIKLIPAYFVMLLISLALLFIVNVDYRVDILKQVAAAFSFQTNWYEILTGGSYEAQFIKHIFVHTWFISVQMHFYIIWPLVLQLLWTSQYRKNSLQKMNLVKATVLILMVLSYGLLIVGSLTKVLDTSFLYFSDFTRFSSFLLGAYFVHIEKSIKDIKVPSGFIIPVFMLIMLGFSVITKYESTTTFSVIMPLVDLLSISVLFACQHPKRKIWEGKLFRYLTQANYGIYLFHWPLFVIFSALFPKYGWVYAIIGTTGLVIGNLFVWEPMFQAENKKIEKNRFNRIISMSSVLFLIVLLTSFLNHTDPKILSLEKSLWESSVQQDFNKIMEDKKILDEFLEREEKKRQAKLLEEQKETDRKAEEEYNRLIQEMEEKEAEKKDAEWPNQILLIGDSVLITPAENLQKNIPNLRVNAEGFRRLDQGVGILKSELDANSQIDAVVIALGTNSIQEPTDDLVSMMDLIKTGQRVIWVTPYNSAFPESKVARIMRELSANYPFVTVMDWETFAREHPDLYSDTDGVHFGSKEITNNAYANLLTNAIHEAMQKAAK